MDSPSSINNRFLRRRWEVFILLLALLLSFVCVFLATWLAFIRQVPEKLPEANMLASSQADYGGASQEFAPIDPRVAAEAATDAAYLSRTPDMRDAMPALIGRLPATPTPTLTPTPSPTAISQVAGPPAVGSTGTLAPSPTRPPTATRMATLTATPRIATGTLVPSITPSHTPPPTATTLVIPTNTLPPPTATRADTSTPEPPPPATDKPEPPSPPTSTPTATPVPPTPTDTPVPPTPTDTPTPPAPQVLAVSPSLADNDTAVDLVITGTNFLSGPTASLIDGGETSLTTTYVSSTSLYAVVPAWFNADYYGVKVTNTDLQSDTLTPAFTLTNPIPLITGLTPDTGPDDSDMQVTISGSNFVDGLTATLDSFALNVTFVDSTTLTAGVPIASSVMPGGFYTLTLSNPGPLTPSSSLTEAFTVTVAYGPPPICSGGATNCGAAEGEPDGNAGDPGTVADIPQGATLTFTLPPGSGITNGAGTDYDFVFFEFPIGAGIQMDWVVVEISQDGSTNWCEVFDWGNQNPPEPSPRDLDTNTNIEPPYGSDGNGESDNEVIPGSALWPRPDGQQPNTGIAIDISVCPAGSYRYIRFSCLDSGSGGDGAQVDAILRLH